MKVIVKETKEVVCEVVTNHSMTLYQALDFGGFDEKKWCQSHGWDCDNLNYEEVFEMQWDD